MIRSSSASGQAWLLAQVKGLYKLEQDMALEYWLSQIDSSFTTGIDLLTVFQLNKVLWFWRLALGTSRVFFEPVCCIGTVAVRQGI